MASTFKPRLPKTKDSGLLPLVDGKLGEAPYAVDVRLARPDGTTFRRRAFNLTTKAEARKRRDQFYEEYNIEVGGAEFAQTLVVKAEEAPAKLMLHEWLDECEKIWPTTHPATATRYKLDVKKRIKPFFPDMPLDEIEGSHVMTWINRLFAEAKHAVTDAPISTSSIKNAHVALGSACALAVQRGKLKVSPTRGLIIRWRAMQRETITPPKITLTQKQLDQVVESAKGEDYYSVVLLQARLGLRVGEAIALRAEDFDLDKKTVTINKQAKRSDDGSDKLKIVKTKNAASDRVIPIPQSVAAFVKGKKGLLLGNPDGTNMDYSKCINGYVSIRGRTRIRGLSSHVLRHTFISFLLNDKRVPVSTVQRLAGHSSINTTLSYYSHASEDNLVEAIGYVS